MKQKSKTRKIARKKHSAGEPKIDKEHQKQVDALATLFKEDQLKAVLRRCYNNVQKYGPEAIMKAVEDSWTAWMATACHGVTDDKAFVKVEQEIAENYEETLEINVHYGTTHPHKETSKKNALFLIESSECLDDYDPNTLAEMKRAYETGHYDDVADLAYLHDRNRRPIPMYPEVQVNDDTILLRDDKGCSPWHRVSELLEEVAEEGQREETPLKCCVEAVRQLSRDLSYDNNAAAKGSIRKAIKYLEE